MVNLKLLSAAQRQTWEMGIRDGENEEKYRISRKEGEERFNLTLSAFGILLLLFYVTGYSLTLLFLSSSMTAALRGCLCDLHHCNASTLSPAAIPSFCLGKMCNSMCPSCTTGMRLGPVPAPGECGMSVPASRMGHR